MERILIVDDEKSIMFAMSHYFKGHGYDVDCAGDVESARLFISEREYALAIVDIHLVGRAGDDGLDLAEWICRERINTAVIVMTALDSPETEQRAATIGVRSFVKKPARLAHLANVVFAAIGHGPAEAV
ncbi:MAG TPA: response regulator [Thermoanaerobaculia bacterium]|nr:response regulator [Thermoanaerobaculia bacterium]